MTKPATAAATGRHDRHRPPAPGALGRLGSTMVARRRWVFGIWLIALVALGSAAPSVFSSLAGAGWQANGSESVQVRELAQQHFGGNSSAAVQVVVHSDTATIEDAAVQQTLTDVAAVFDGDTRFGEIIAPQPGMTISPDGRTGILIAGANASTDDMVKAVDEVKGELTELSGDGIEVYPTGSSALWSDFNKANHDAMIQAELFSWPVTLAIMVLAFGSLVAAGLPLLLTVAGLVASAGGLVLLNGVTPISVWAMNFAMMFALALGIDYALFIVARFRDALRNADPRAAVAETMDTAGKAVVLSGLTVLVSLSAVLLVPAPAVRTMAVGIMLAVTFVLIATMTLLPATLGALGSKVNAASLPYAKRQQHRSPKFAAWGELLHKHPWPFALVSVGILIVLALPVLGLKVAMPSITVVPEDAPVRQGYELVQAQFGDGAPGALQIVVPSSDAAATATAASSVDGISMVTPPQPAADGSNYSLLQALPAVDPSDESMGTILGDLRAQLPESALVGGAPAENLDLQQALNDYLPLVIGIILALGFILLLVALQAPLIAILGTAVSLLSTAAAFGVAKLIFQDGHGASLLGFTPQGFLDGWGPVFFFAMIFAIAMDYTVFLLATAKEHYEKTGDPKAAQVDGLAHSGRVIFAAAAVMVAVFFTFALSDPLPPKEMGIILGVAVLLDAFLIRLILLPVLLRLTGHAAWWSPAWLRKVLPSISFSH
ncbi:MMPL family transporter [Rhodococcus fascians]|nr:MMPL family transporter [Rhodococcus sp. ANT_H53B]MBY4213344.1 MMPL family transporter [Rhodococcus fascians]OZC94797.1 multidrug RND transporter [Rhodococcus sp. 06-235-1A]OZD55902.1 multidrug RND transporter [Rhodococcus sp. 06-1474-1B]OZD71845.1 multidrug RND transporter [Rhodococcus sp. 05-340-1]OZD73510.1 multidrug RND transporter [Rhodococcus sp. 05-340-2]OZE24313.1 multidrug RND transporter [Rhodococcus sp. 05-2255-1e]OZF05994.1 multidrug RND transporter [Rhodococcus sp. 15-1154-1]